MTKPEARLEKPLPVLLLQLPKDKAFAPRTLGEGPGFSPKNLGDVCWSLSWSQWMGNRDMSGPCEFGGS